MLATSHREPPRTLQRTCSPRYLGQSAATGLERLSQQILTATLTADAEPGDPERYRATHAWRLCSPPPNLLVGHVTDPSHHTTSPLYDF